MAVEALGKKDPTAGREVSCKSCGERLRYYKGDVADNCHEGGDHYYIYCPACRNKVTVKPWY